MRKKIKWNYICAVICFVLFIIKMYMPNLITSLKEKVDFKSIFLVTVGICLIIYPYAIKIFRKIYEELTIRIIISLFCIVLVILKMFYKELIIDNTSIYLIIVAIIVVLIPDLNNVIQRITKIKKGDFELEFTLKNLLSKVVEVEKDIQSKKGNSNLNYGGIDKETVTRFELISADPSAVILTIGVEIEIRLRKLLEESDNHQYSIQPMFKMQKRLSEIGILTNNQANLLNEFRKVRNVVAHGVDINEITDEKLYEVADLGLRILETLPTKVGI